MWQEISRGFRTEIDFINSAKVTELRERGNSTPFNTITGDKIRLRESRITSGEHS
jgi:ketopantoate reductase